MEKMKQQLIEWGKDLEDFHLPHWEELPDLDLYMDQVRDVYKRQQLYRWESIGD